VGNIVRDSAECGVQSQPPFSHRVCAGLLSRPIGWLSAHPGHRARPGNGRNFGTARTGRECRPIGAGAVKKVGHYTIIHHAEYLLVRDSWTIRHHHAQYFQVGSVPVLSQLVIRSCKDDESCGTTTPAWIPNSDLACRSLSLRVRTFDLSMLLLNFSEPA
jgi:hypothetical protein